MSAEAMLFVTLLSLTFIVVLFWWMRDAQYSSPPPRRPHRHRCLEEAFNNPAALKKQPYNVKPERFEAQPPATATAPAPTEESPPAIDLQVAMDFSDVTVPEAERSGNAVDTANAEQLQTIDERFKAAKRNIAEHKLKNGVYTSGQRRKLVEALLRRPQRGRRVRSWRTENSDYLRGDVIPKASGQSTNLVRSAKNNPVADLHPGALGPMAGMQGQWLSEENIPGNLFEDTAIFV